MVHCVQQTACLMMWMCNVYTVGDVTTISGRTIDDGKYFRYFYCVSKCEVRYATVVVVVG